MLTQRLQLVPTFVLSFVRVSLFTIQFCGTFTVQNNANLRAGNDCLSRMLLKINVSTTHVADTSIDVVTPIDMKTTYVLT